MSPAVAPEQLSLADHACLAIVAEGPTHGWAIVKLLAFDGDLGRIWSLSRPLTYRALDRLVDAGLVDRTARGRRADLTITASGRATSAAWLVAPVEHVRDLRTEFLLKLRLCERSGLDIGALVAAQRDRLGGAIDALTAGAADEIVDMWRQESALAAQRFLDRLATP